ncbi:MAG TPA: M48 family metallopeptidase [Kofleriaceae bacterium]|jgi:hypothetical protein
MSVGVDFDFAKWIAQRRGAQEQQAREGAAYAFAPERSFRRTLAIARPVTMALEATTRLWKDHAREELLAKATAVTDEQLPRIHAAAKRAGGALRVRVPAIFGVTDDEFTVNVLGTEDAPHLLVNTKLAEQLSDAELTAAIGHELGHVQNGHILFTTALYYLTKSAAFYVRWVVQPAIMTLRAWGKRAELTCDRAALLAVRDVEAARSSLHKVGEAAGSARIALREKALELFASSALYATVIGVDPTGRPSLIDIDKQVGDL